MNTSSINATALALRHARQNRTTLPPVRDTLAKADIETAYAIQEINTNHRLSEGHRLVGRKIGLTSKAVQHQLGVDQPDFGMLFADMAVGDGEPISIDCLIQPKVEAEIALIIGRDLKHERHTYADIINATEYALPAIEIVDSRIADWHIRIVDTIADNASSGLFVLGSRPVQLSHFDIADCEMKMTSGTETVSQGNGRACLDNPLNAAIWLADAMVRRGRPLLAGDIILTGALGPMVIANPGERFDVFIDGLGNVATCFADT